MREKQFLLEIEDVANRTSEPYAILLAEIRAIITRYKLAQGIRPLSTNGDLEER